MAQAKKYGVFSGVFTPSILTILGVIMYMRLPWIAGQAGLCSVEIHVYLVDQRYESEVEASVQRFFPVTLGQV
ncbi:MAG: hypothetical protein HKP58_20675 [Desulfatitalea sp.]|nr:hypothetical protein [Desulfatitalea sp.]NNK02834.1 hypothetical protein [Desulfatitalea sp.]